MERTLTPEQATLIREVCKEKIDRADALERLCKNTDFKSVFMDNYVEKEPARIVSLLADASMNHSDKRDLHRVELQERMIGIARFSEYLRMINMLANHAEKDLKHLIEAEKSYYSGSTIDVGTEITTNT